MKSKIKTNRPDKLQIITLVIASLALLLGIATLLLTIDNMRIQAVVDESASISNMQNTIAISRMQTCLDEKIEACNLTDMTKPVDLNYDKYED